MALRNRRLHPGGVLILQQRNYQGFEKRGVRDLPPRRLVDGDDELQFRVALEFGEGGIVGAHETYWSGTGPEARQHFARHRSLQGWRVEEIRVFLEVARFRSVRVSGGFADEPFDADLSDELVVVAS